MKIRTDMASEVISSAGDIYCEGVGSRTAVNEQAKLEIQRIHIFSEQAAEKLGKPVGRYVTVRMTDEGIENYSDVMKLRTQLIAHEIHLLAPNARGVLVAGLGNQSITPDAIGPLCAQRVFATRHIRQLGNELDMGELTEVSVIRPGVLGQTGIEASDLVKAACSRIDADTVIAVDALACSETHNLGRTIQLTDTGISPGSGVANSRKELSRRTLGANCIAIGIPTVIDYSSADGTMMVTPRGVDRLVQNGAEYIAMAINLAFQPSLSYEDISSLV